MTSVGASSKLVEMEQPRRPRLSDSAIESNVDERVFRDVNNTNFVKLDAKDAARQR